MCLLLLFHHQKEAHSIIIAMWSHMLTVSSILPIEQLPLIFSLQSTVMEFSVQWQHPYQHAHRMCGIICIVYILYIIIYYTCIESERPQKSTLHIQLFSMELICTHIPHHTAHHPPKRHDGIFVSALNDFCHCRRWRNAHKSLQIQYGRCYIVVYTRIPWEICTSLIHKLIKLYAHPHSGSRQKTKMID